MAENDRQKARERNQNLKKEGKSKRERILDITKKMTAGKLVIEGGSFALDDDVLMQGETREMKALEALGDKRRADDLKNLQQCYKADRAYESNNTPNVTKWRSMKQIKSYLTPLKQDGDPRWPKSRDKLEVRYFQWQHRQRIKTVPDEDTMQLFRHWLRKRNQGEKKKSKRNTQPKTINGNKTI